MFRSSENIQGILMYQSVNPIAELSALCEQIITNGVLRASGKRLLTAAWIKACCRQPNESKQFPLHFSQTMHRSDRNYAVDVGLVEAFTDAFDSAEQAHSIFFELVTNTKGLLDLYEIVSSVGPVRVDDRVLRRSLEGVIGGAMNVVNLCYNIYIMVPCTGR
jgi:hypothetical protein